MRRILLVLALVAVTLVAWPAFAQTADIMRQGNDAYAKQEYEAAVARYEQLAERGMRHPDLFYNLGNAYFRAGRLGPAILSYHRALALAPDNEDARYNLEVAQERVEARYGKDRLAGAAEEPTWIKVVQFVPLPVLMWGFLALDVLFFAGLIALRFRHVGFLRTGLLVMTVFVGVAWVGTGVLFASRLYVEENVQVGIVVADEVVMREGPDPTRRAMPTLHAGHRVVILRESQGWLRIQLANRVEGWVPKAAVEGV